MTRGKAPKTLRLIEACHEILAEIQPATVRAVCYRLFVKKLIRDMSRSCTNWVSKQLVCAREKGSIPWGWIVDETREAERISMWDNPEAFVNSVQRSYRRNRWADQPTQVEVWSEKGTVRGTLAPILNKYGVTFRVMHGYGSATVINDIASETGGGAPLLVLYAGDWDPSGMHMSAVDLPERLERYGASVDIERIALTADHIANHGLPSFAADTKRKDPRYSWFAHHYGETCWELDALSPVTLREAVEGQILRIIDEEEWARCEKVEKAERESFLRITDAWRRPTASPNEG